MTPIGGPSWAGAHLGAFQGGPFLGCIMGTPGANFGVYIGANFGGLFEVMLYGVSQIDNSLAFPISI